MIREQESWTTSELIYLFVDGEADDVQKSLLFSALANDAGLQAEFSDAIRINAAVQDEQIEGAPPAYVTAALFQKAGFGVAAGEAIPPVVGTVAETIAGTTAAKGVAGYLRSVAVPILSAFIGGMIALFFAPNGLQQSGNNGSNMTQSLPLLSSVSQSSQMEHNNVAKENTLQEQSLRTLPRAMSAPIAKTTRAQKINTLGAQKNEAAPALNGEKNETNASDGRLDNGSNGIEATNAEEINSTQNGNIEHPSELQQPMPEIREVNRPAPPAAAIGNEDISLAIAMEEELNQHSSGLTSSLPMSSPSTFEVRKPIFALQVRGMAEIESFPNRSLVAGTESAFQNIAITGFYNISEHHAIGIEVGREYHPLYVPTGSVFDTTDLSVANPGGSGPGIGITIHGAGLGSGSGGGRISNVGTAADFTEQEPTAATTITTGYKLEPTTVWGGVTYQFRANPIDRLGMIRPYVQAMVGGTQLGPIGKATLGLSWTPDSRVSFGLGLEGTALLYQNNGGWYSSRKLGLSYGAQVNF